MLDVVATGGAPNSNDGGRFVGVPLLLGVVGEKGCLLSAMRVFNWREVGALARSFGAGVGVDWCCSCCCCDIARREGGKNSNKR